MAQKTPAKKTLLEDLEDFQGETGLSDHRIGMIVANNGRLLERLRAKRRIWPHTEDVIRARLSVERARRKTTPVREAS